MATILTVTANPLLDHLAAAPTLPGTRIERFAVVAGGKGINVGRVLARHGHRVIATGFCGGATGEQSTALIASDGIEPALVPTAARSRIGFMCMPPQGPPVQVMERGFAVTPQEMGGLVDQVRRLLPGCALCIIGGSVPDASCDSLYRLVLEICHQAGIECWVDSYGPAMDEALGGPHPPSLVKPNHEEYAPSTRRWVSAPEMHLTDGGREIRVRHREGRFRITPPAVVESNAVGSGDCYLAGLAHARLSGAGLMDQLRYAAAAGAANAAAGAVARIAPRDIQALVDQVSVQEVDA